MSETHPEVNAVAAAWARGAAELAEWAYKRLVNRTDAWGGYRPLEEVGKEYRRADGTTGKFGAQTTRKGNLTPLILAAHFRGQRRADLVGLHSTSAGNTSRDGWLDIDWHGPTSTAPEVNLAAALHWCEEEVRQGFRPLLLDSNGRGGYHLGTIFRDPVPTAAVYHFLRRLTADHARLGMAVPPERFPKQPSLGAGLRFGNWLRLPGRHHTREHWSRVWDGRRWLEGAEAVEWLLAVEGDDPALLPPAPAAAAQAAPPRPLGTPHRSRQGSSSGNLARRIAAYLGRLPNLGEGQGRDDVAYHFACWLVRDLALSDPAALDWLERWDEGNAPPKGRERLAEILAGAHKYGRRAYGSGVGTASAPARSRHEHSTISFTIEVS
jgi:hypothetical protein